MNPSEPSPHKIGILGAAGTIGSIIATTLLEQGFPPPQLLLGDPREGLFQSGSFSLSLIASANEVMAQADIVVLCIKPQVWKTLLLPYRNGQIIVSPMAGIAIETIREAGLAQGAHIKIARFMPNTACRIGQGLIGSFAPDLSAEEFSMIKGLYASGELIQVNSEDDLNKMTVPASAIAFYFYIVELLEHICLEAQLPSKESLQTILEGCLESLKSATDGGVNTKGHDLEALLQNAFCIVYLKALELAGIDPALIEQTPIAQQRQKTVSTLEMALHKIVKDLAGTPDSLKAVSRTATHSFIKALRDFFIQNHFSIEQADLIAKQTVKGAYGLMTEPEARSAAILRTNVTSKGGTTEAGLKALGLLLSQL
jgi:pyrroline-5-carboxylate reductase